MITKRRTCAAGPNITDKGGEIMRRIVTVTLLGVGLLLTGCASDPRTAALTVTETPSAVTSFETSVVSTTVTTETPITVMQQEYIQRTVQETVLATTTEVRTVDKTVKKTVTVTVEPPGPAAAFDDGSYLVGKDVQPGTYQTDGLPGEKCYWVRLDKANDIIDNSYGGTVMTIVASDFLVETENCGDWVLVG